MTKEQQRRAATAARRALSVREREEAKKLGYTPEQTAQMEAEPEMADYEVLDEFFKEVYGTKYRQTLLASVKSHVRKDIVPDFLANHRRGDNPKEWDTLADILTHLFTGMFEECIGSDEAADPDEMMGVVERLCGASMHRMIDDYLAFSGAN